MIRRIVVISAVMLVLVRMACAAGVRSLRCEYQEDPVGIDETKPRLSWKMVSKERGEKQTAYRVIVASSAKKLAQDEGDLWDTGKVESDQSTHLVYGGKDLESRMECHWKVMVWDKDGNASKWSDTVTWSMGLLDEKDWKARWVGLLPEEIPLGGGEAAILRKSHWIWYPEGNPRKKAPAGIRYFRREVKISDKQKLRKAALVVSADDRWAVSLNDEKLGTGRNYRKPTLVNVRDKLKPGKNVVSVEVRNSGREPNPAGLIGSLYIEYRNGDKEEVYTDSKWEVSQSEDGKWKSAKVLGRYDCDPWSNMNRFRIRVPKRIVPARYTRKEFGVQKKISKATAYICGMGNYVMFINGKRVGDHEMDPILRDYEKQWPYVTYDVTKLLSKGKNAIGVMLGNGYFLWPHPRPRFNTRDHGYPMLLLQVEVEYEDGSRDIIVSDESWTITDQGPITDNNVYNGEKYDARMEMPGWNSVGFDAKGWKPVEMVSAPGIELTSAACMQPMRVTGIIKPVKITQPKEGVWVFDMGQNMVGRCRLKVKGPAGTQVKMHFAENMYPDGMLDFRNLRSAECTDIYTLGGKGVEKYAPAFTFHGFRYVEVTGYPGKPDLETLTGEIINTDMPFAGDFSCSDPTISQILKNARWGIRGNYLSIPTDCPQRDERLGWQGDRAMEQKGEAFLFDNIALYEKWMGDVVDSQIEDGNLSVVCPKYWAWYPPNVTWPASFAIIPGNLRLMYGNKRAIERNYPAFMRWLKYLESLEDDGIIRQDKYGDWCCPPEDKHKVHSGESWRKTPPEILSTAYYYRVLRIAAEYAELLGRKKDVQNHLAKAEKVRKAFNEKLYNKEGGYYGNGSQTSQILPLYFGMLSSERHKKVFDYMVNHIETKTGGAMGTGLIGGQWLMRTLSDNGRIDIAYRFATRREYPSWGYMIEQGATTLWELWNGDTANPGMNSGNHVMLLGDLIIWMFEYLGGIKPDKDRPGFKHVIMKPRTPGDLKFAMAEHESPYGTIRSDWTIDDKTFRWNIRIPPNSTATVYLPAKDAHSVTESGRPVTESAGIRFLRMQEDRAVIDAGSGSYSFLSTIDDGDGRSQ